MSGENRNILTFFNFLSQLLTFLGLALNIYYYDNDDDYRSIMSQVKHVT